MTNMKFLTLACLALGVMAAQEDDATESPQGELVRRKDDVEWAKHAAGRCQSWVNNRTYPEEVRAAQIHLHDIIIHQKERFEAALREVAEGQGTLMQRLHRYHGDVTLHEKLVVQRERIVGEYVQAGNVMDPTGVIRTMALSRRRLSVFRTTATALARELEPTIAGEKQMRQWAESKGLPLMSRLLCCKCLTCGGTGLTGDSGANEELQCQPCKGTGKARVSVHECTGFLATDADIALVRHYLKLGRYI